MADQGFAQPAKKLFDSGIPNTVAPAPGYGFTLDEKGRVPLTTENGRWTLEYVETSVDFPNTAAHSGGNLDVTFPTAKIGDFAVLATAPTSQFIVRVKAIVTVEGQVTLTYFNADTVSVDPANNTYSFLLFHRFVT
jgi:hypothetical protein